MPTAGKKYTATIGLSVGPETDTGFADFGLCYRDMELSVVVQVEALFAKHQSTITEALKPLVEDLVALGMAGGDENTIRTILSEDARQIKRGPAFPQSS